MIAVVELAGRSRQWRFLEGHQLADWLADEPWYQCARPFTAHVAPAFSDLVVHEARAEVRKVLGAGDFVRVDELGPDLCDAGPRRALWSWMNLPEGSARALAEKLASLSKDTPRLYIARLGPGSVGAAWGDSLQRVLDIQAKLERSGHSTFIITDGGRIPAAGGCRLDLAWPTPGVLLQDREDRWAAYIHERVAWHAGGNLEVAVDTGSGMPHLAVGDDWLLERSLDDHARAMHSTLDGELLEELGRGLGPVVNDPWLQIPSGLAGFDSRTGRPAPWIARALLLRHADHPNRRYLRSLCVCRPLANRLLGRCQDLEQHVRDRLLRNLPSRAPGELAERTVQRLATRADAIEHRLTPMGRLDDLDPWEMASLHDLIEAADQPEPVKRNMHMLRQVRNALAHGSPVGWEAFNIVEDLEDRLGKLRRGPE